MRQSNNNRNLKKVRTWSRFSKITRNKKSPRNRRLRRQLRAHNHSSWWSYCLRIKMSILLWSACVLILGPVEQYSVPMEATSSSAWIMNTVYLAISSKKNVLWSFWPGNRASWRCSGKMVRAPTLKLIERNSQISYVKWKYPIPECLVNQIKMRSTLIQQRDRRTTQLLQKWRKVSSCPSPISQPCRSLTKKTSW